MFPIFIRSLFISQKKKKNLENSASKAPPVACTLTTTSNFVSNWYYEASLAEPLEMESSSSV
jgi:hypothetical protein